MIWPGKLSVLGYNRRNAIWDKQTIVNHSQVWRTQEERALIEEGRIMGWVILNKSLLEKSESLGLWQLLIG